MTLHDATLRTLNEMAASAELRMIKLRKHQPSAWQYKFNHLARLKAEATMILTEANNYPRAVNCAEEFAAALMGGPHV